MNTAVGTVPVRVQIFEKTKGTVPTMLDAACSRNKPRGGLTWQVSIEFILWVI